MVTVCFSEERQCSKSILIKQLEALPHHKLQSSLRLLPLLPIPHPEHHTHLFPEFRGLLICNIAYKYSFTFILTAIYLVESLSFLTQPLQWTPNGVCLSSISSPSQPPYKLVNHISFTPFFQNLSHSIYKSITKHKRLQHRIQSICSAL